MEKIDKFISKNIIWIIVFLSLLASRYLLVQGFFGVSDDLHIGWLNQMDRTLKSGQFPPRFVPDLSFGFGYPLFTFVYPLPFYVAEVLHLFGFSLVDSIKIVFGLSMFLSVYFMYILLKRYVNSSYALLGSALYLYTPYRALEIFVRGSLGEIVSFVFFPLIILSVVNKKSSLLAFSLCGLILSHNIMAYMFMPFLLLLIILNKSFWHSMKGIVLGLLLSIYFWFPAIYESKLMKYDTVFNFYDHFPTLKQLIIPYWGYGASVAGPYDTMSFNIGLVGIVVFLIGFLVFIFKHKIFKKGEIVLTMWSVVIVFFSLFMMNYRSAFLWENIPFFSYFQFPWRFLAMIVLAIPFFVISISKLEKLTPLPLVIFFGAIILNFNYFRYSEYLGRDDDYYLKRYVPFPVVDGEYLKTSEEYLRMLKNQAQKPNKVYPRAYSNDQNVKLKIEEINSLDAVIYSKSDNDFILNYSKYFYPGWRVKINDKKVKAVSGYPFSQIAVDIPAGENKIEVYYRESLFRLIFDFVSLFSFLYLIWQIFSKRKN